jgi:hypothetical protein
MSRHTPEGSWRRRPRLTALSEDKLLVCRFFGAPRVVQAQEVPLQREQVHPPPAYERNMGVSPDCEEGKRHRKRGDALFRAFPAMAEDLPVGHILSLVLIAMLRGLVPRPASFLESRAGPGVLALAGSCWLMLAHAGGVPCFIADLADLSRDRRPATSTLRTMQLDATGGLGQVKQWATAHQVAPVDAPSIQNPPCGRMADRPLVS